MLKQNNITTQNVNIMLDLYNQMTSSEYTPFIIVMILKQSVIFNTSSRKIIK